EWPPGGKRHLLTRRRDGGLRDALHLLPPEPVPGGAAATAASRGLSRREADARREEDEGSQALDEARVRRSGHARGQAVRGRAVLEKGIRRSCRLRPGRLSSGPPWRRRA